MGILSLIKNLNLGFAMPTTTSAGTMEAKKCKEAEHDNRMPLTRDHNEITGVDKDTRFRSDEVSYDDLERVFIGYPPKPSVPDCPYHPQTGSCTIGMDWNSNHPSREENVEGKLEALSGQRRLAKFKGDQGQGHIASSENVGQIECKFYLLPGGCKYGDDCGFFHHVQLNFLGLPIRPGEKKCPFYMRTGGCKFANRCRFHHPDPTAVVGDSFQDRKNGVPSQHHGPVEQLCETPRSSEKTSNEQTPFLGPFTPNRGLQQNVQWNGNQTTTSLLHPREMNINDQRKTLGNRHIAYEFSGDVEVQQFEEYPQMPSEPECQYFMKTGYCKFKSACRYHHPKLKVSFLGLPQRPVSNNHQHRGPVDQLRETPSPSVNTSNEQTVFLSPPSSYVSDLFTPNQGLKQNEQWNEHQMATIPLHSPEIKINGKGQELANKDAAYEFNGGVKSQQLDEYPQRPSEPECHYFMKTGYCKFKSACRCHHPKPNLSFPAPPLKPMDTGPLHPPEIKMIEKGQEIANNNTDYEFNGGVKSQQFDEYPQRPSEPECQYFMKTGYCKFKSACKCHHPKSNHNFNFPAPPLKPDKPICTYYSRRGICKFGSACRYNHIMEHT